VDSDSLPLLVNKSSIKLHNIGNSSEVGATTLPECTHASSLVAQGMHSVAAECQIRDRAELNIIKRGMI
jgi:hypothetical protein